MMNRCDSVDALMYAYYEFMRIKEENQMLEKNKDYIEMRVSSTDCAFTQNEPTSICVDGYVYTTYMNLPDPGELYVLISKEKFEKMQADVNINAEIAKQREINYDLLLKKIGFDTVEELVNYLNSEAECDTLREAISKLKDQVKYTCEEWYGANSRNNSWKVAAECNSPKELIEKREALEKKIDVYSRALQEWKEGTGCPSPSAAKTLIESGASWCHAYGDVKKQNEKLAEEIKKWKTLTKCETPEAAATWITSYESACGRGNRLAEMVEKLKEEVVSWKNVTEYSTPEEYLAARIRNAFSTPFDYTAAWHKATGCDTPDQVKSHIEEFERIVRLTNKNMLSTLDSEIDEWQKFTGCNSPQEAGVKINNLCDDICKWKGNYDHILKLTGYENEKDIRVLLTFNNNKYICKTMREYINYLTRNAKFTESNWQNATGCNTPGEAETTMRNLKGRIDEIKEFAAIASNWTDRIVED